MASDLYLAALISAYAYLYKNIQDFDLHHFTYLIYNFLYCNTPKYWMLVMYNKMVVVLFHLDCGNSYAYQGIHRSLIDFLAIFGSLDRFVRPLQYHDN